MMTAQANSGLETKKNIVQKGMWYFQKGTEGVGIYSGTFETFKNENFKSVIFRYLLEMTIGIILTLLEKILTFTF